MVTPPLDVKRVSLTKAEINILSLVMHHLTDYMAGDDRTDHGWNKLKDLRSLTAEEKRFYYLLAGKMRRASVKK